MTTECTEMLATSTGHLINAIYNLDVVTIEHQHFIMKTVIDDTRLISILSFSCTLRKHDLFSFLISKCMARIKRFPTFQINDLHFFFFWSLYII